jgi:hypothetical protein
VILEPVQTSARVVTRSFRSRPCARCPATFTPEFAGSQYCPACRTITCEVCSLTKTFAKYEPNRKVCGLSCAGKKGNKSAKRKGFL